VVKNLLARLLTKKKLPPPPQDLIGKITVYLETSGSMRGYFKGITKFKNTIPSILVGIEKMCLDSTFVIPSKPKLENFTVARIHDKVYPYKTAEFANLLGNFNENVANGKSSEIQKMLTTIVETNPQNGISLFVSDCILSYPTQDLRATPNKNIEQIGGLSALLSRSFNNINGFAVSVFAFKSEFHGEYYTCKNEIIDYNLKKENLFPEKRPYYIWVIGKPALLARFNQRLKQISDFTPLQELHFGLANAATSPSKCLIVRDLLKGAQPDKNNLLQINEIDKDSKELSFVVGLDLAKYALPENEIKNLLKVSSIDATTSITSIETKDVFKAIVIDNKRVIDKIHPQRKQEIENYSHFVMIKANNLSKKTEIQISLPVRTATWYHDWSVEDDSKIGSDFKIREKTFAFKYMIKAMDEVFNTKKEDEATKNHFSHKVTLLKE
jgi:hypothetical protein